MENKKPEELRVILTGATGMIGSGVLKSCLEDPGVASVLSLSRSLSGQSHPKLKEILLKDFFGLAEIESQLAPYDACLFCLGVSSVGMGEADYTRVTHDLTLNLAQTLLRLNPGMSFVYVSGQATDSTEKGPAMWARVKGRIENALLAMPFHPAVMVRPGGILPMQGVASKTVLYRVMYAVLGPLFRPLLPYLPGMLTTSERLGRAMLKAARGEAGKAVLESRDINSLGA